MVSADIGKNSAKNKKKREQAKKKKEQAGDSPEDGEKVEAKVQFVSDIELKLTGNQEIDKQLKDLKKVGVYCYIPDQFN